MSRRSATAAWSGLFQRSLKALTRQATRSQAQATKAAASAVKKAVRRATAQAAQQVKQQVKRQVKQQVARQAARPKAPPAGSGDWLAGVALGPAGARRYRLYRPAGLRRGERLPLLVMLHGCGQDANAFAASTRMNRLAERERCLVLYPEQDRLANPQGCWNWYDTQRGRAQGGADLVLAAIDQVCLL